MTEFARNLRESSGPRATTGSINVSRLDFVTQVPEGATVWREFREPRHTFAVLEPSTLESIAHEAVDPNPTDECLVAFLTGEPNQPIRELMSSGSATIRVERDGESIEWRPGIAAVQCRPGTHDAALAALAEFAHFEGQLRLLEKEVERGEVQAQRDVGLAWHFRYRDRARWKDFATWQQTLARVRLTYARVEPHLTPGLGSLPVRARPWMSRLLRKGRMDTRLEALSNRLEALEDFYESAHQRSSEFRWYAEGHMLEMAIIALLILECLLMSADIYTVHQARVEEAAWHGAVRGPLAAPTKPME